MRITEICFTCGGHAALAAAMDNPRPGVRRIWVVDQVDAEIKPPPGVEVWVMPFDRGGNLRGWPAINGILAAFARAFREGADAVIKRDSDTRISSDAVMTAYGPGQSALFVHKLDSTKLPWKGFGAGYSVTAAALPILQRAAMLKLYNIRSAFVPEDDFFSFTLTTAGVMKLLPVTAARFTRNTQAWVRPASVQEAWVNCGNQWNIAV